MIYYYFPILALFLSMIAFFHTGIKYAVLLFIFTFVVCFCGLRFYADIDYRLYVELFNETPVFEQFNSVSIQALYGEVGYLAFTSIIKSFGFDFFLVTLIISFISMFLKVFVASKFSKIPHFAISLYLCLYFVTVEFIELRWSIATGLIFLAVFTLKLNKSITAFCILILATLFHYFTLLYFSAYFILKRNQSFLNLFFIISFMLALFYKFFGMSISYEMDSEIYLIKRILRYINDPESSLGIFSYLKILFYYATFFVLNKFNVSNDLNVFLEKYAVYFMGLALLLSFIPLFFYRAMVIGDFFSILLISNLIYNCRSLTLKVTYIYVFVVLFSAWSFRDVNNYANSDYIYEYSTWLRFLW